MNILAIETSARRCQLGLAVGEQFTAREEEDGSHSNVILAMVESLLDEASIEIGSLDVIAVTQGPGSFTGLRIGVAVAQALAYAQQIPVLPISTLALTAWEYVCECEDRAIPCRVLATIDARMHQLYAAWYEWDGLALQLQGEEALFSPSAMAVIAGSARSQNSKFPLVGSGVDYCQEFPAACSETLDYLGGCAPTVTGMLSYCRHWLNTNGQLPDLAPESLAPVYIRNKVTG